MESTRPNRVETVLLVKLMEECAEVVQACSKVLEHGFTARNEETGVVYNNQLDLASELGDVLAAIHVLCEMVRTNVRNTALNHRMIETFAYEKRIKLRVLAARRNAKE